MFSGQYSSKSNINKMNLGKSVKEIVWNYEYIRQSCSSSCLGFSRSTHKLIWANIYKMNLGKPVNNICWYFVPFNDKIEIVWSEIYYSITRNVRDKICSTIESYQNEVR